MRIIQLGIVRADAEVTTSQVLRQSQMVRLPDSDYFTLLRTKMGWSGDLRGGRG